MEEIVRLTKEDYDECFGLMNTVFGRQNGRVVDFTKELPKMCRRDEESLGKHFGVRVDGKLVAALGVYPLPGMIFDTPVLFSTVGNVVTLPEYEGRGFMTKMLQTAMGELDRLGVDASRLGGYRQRYNRFGYEAAGTVYTFEIDPNNSKCCHKPGEKLTFAPIEAEDEAALRYADGLYRQGGIFLDRSITPKMRDAYDSMTAWRSRPYIVKGADARPVGYFSLAADNRTMNEVFAESEEQLENLIFSYQEQIGQTLVFPLSPCRREAVKYFSSIAGAMRINFPCLFKILDFSKIAGALMRLKNASFPGLPDGEFVMNIENYGSLRLFAHAGEIGAEKTVKQGRLTLSYFEAIRLLFGPMGPETFADFDPFLNAWLPLPLSWSTLDRV